MTHICIDGLNLALPHGSGIATYGRQLLSSIRAIGHAGSILYGRDVPGERRPEAREALFFGTAEATHGRVRRAARSLGAALWGTARAEDIPRTGLVARDPRLDLADTIWNARGLFDAAHLRFRLTGRLLAVRNPGGVEICHWTCPLPVRMEGARNLYTFHDLIPLRYPHLVAQHPGRFTRLAEALARSADGIVTVSEHSKRELVEHLGLDRRRVFNTSQAVSIPDLEAGGRGAPGLYGLDEASYFLSFSAIEPKKNLARLIEAYLASGSARWLVIAGPYRWLPLADIRTLANRGLWDALTARPRSAGRIRFVGHVSPAHLDRLIRGAHAVLFASITEGFGLPIIEAMGRGIPVLTSLGGATEEVAGGAALLVDPDDAGAIAAGIRELDGNPALLEQLRAAGTARATRFSTAAYQARLRELYGP